MKYLYLALLVIVAASCGPKKEEQTAETTEAAPASNVLTAEQQAEGWVLLFNGTDLTGWRAYQNKDIDCWDIQDGAIHCKDTTATKRGDIVSTEKYDNYELAFDWKISPGGNSGVIYRASEDNDAPYLSGPEYQVIDNDGYKGGLTELQKAAANYDMHAVTEKVLKPVGEWNSGKIVVNGNHCEHWLNGVKVVDYDFQSDDWKARKSKSKWKDVAPYGMTTKGHIDLQDHGHEVWYRNIMIKAL